MANFILLLLPLLLPSTYSTKPVITVESYPLLYSYYGAKQSTSFINDTAITVSDLISINNPNPNPNVMMAIVDFTSGFVKGDLLTYTPITGNPIVGDYFATDNTGTLTLKGTTTTENYEAALRTVTFKAAPTYDIDDPVTAHTKTLRFNVTDSGEAASDVVTRNINIETSYRVYTSWVQAYVQENRE